MASTTDGPVRVEIGGGTRNRGPGWLNVDQCQGADIQHDLNVFPWPIADASADELYSAHCIEHVKSPIAFCREVARVCRVGATVELRCPDACGEMAMCAGHEAVWSINCVRHMDHIFPELHWQGCQRRLKLTDIQAGGDDYWFPMARKSRLFKGWTDDEILTWIPRTRHENRFYFVVIDTEPHILNGSLRQIGSED
jgi:hypothetical protein